MKKIISTIAVMIIVMVNLTWSQVPDNLKDRFKLQHPDATAIIWSTVDAGLYKISFTEANAKHVLVYDKDMNTVWSRAEVRESEVPAVISDYFKTTYPQEKGYEILMVDENGKTLYYSSFKDKKTVYLDKEGRVTKTVYESKDYPKNIEVYYSKKYPEEKYTVYSEDENGKINYYTVRKGQVMYFDKEGNYVREERYYDYDYK